MRSIPPNLEPAVLGKAGEGLSLREIAAWLEATHGVKTTAPTVNRLLNRIKEERAPIAQAVVREKLAKTLTTDLDAVNGILERARKLEDDAAGQGEMETALRAQDRQLKALTLRLELSGAGNAGEGSVTDLVLEAQRERAGK